MNIQLDCKYCESPINVPLKWAQTNGRVYCDCCSKSFDVAIQIGVDEAKQEDKTVEATVNKDGEIQQVRELDSTLKVDPNTPSDDFDALMGGYFV